MYIVDFANCMRSTSLCQNTSDVNTHTVDSTELLKVQLIESWEINGPKGSTNLFTLNDMSDYSSKESTVTIIAGFILD